MFQIDCDFSGSTIGAILSQKGRPISYLSENLNNSNRKYYVYDQKMYAIVQTLNKCRHHLIPKEFVLYTNYQALKYFNSQRKLNQRHFKWVEFVQSDKFFLKHRSGKSKRVACALCRRFFFLIEIQIEVLGFKELKNLYLKDPNFSESWKAYT